MSSLPINTKYRCGGCGGIFDLQMSAFGPGACPNCGAHEWHQITVTQVCDFCTSPDVIWCFPCKPFQMPAPDSGSNHMSADDWSACDDCKELIEAGRLNDLSQRATEMSIKRSPELASARRVIEASQRELHRCFAANRNGPPVRLDQ